MIVKEILIVSVLVVGTVSFSVAAYVALALSGY
jgi:hypothetical protein